VLKAKVLTKGQIENPASHCHELPAAMTNVCAAAFELVRRTKFDEGIQFNTYNMCGQDHSPSCQYQRPEVKYMDEEVQIFEETNTSSLSTGKNLSPWNARSFGATVYTAPKKCHHKRLSESKSDDETKNNA
jgi:hypothetical protein